MSNPFIKFAEANMPPAPPGAGYEGYTGIANQQFMPVTKRREFSPTEQNAIGQGTSQWWPKIFQSYQTPMSKLLASPGKQSLLNGLLAGGVGALGGGLAGDRTGVGAGVGALAGGVGLGGLAALLTYYKQQQKNEDILELMRRLPEGATRRDMLSDPAYQADKQRANATRNAAMMAAAIARRGQ